MFLRTSPCRRSNGYFTRMHSGDLCLESRVSRLTTLTQPSKIKPFRILHDLEREGYAVSIDATWRSPLRQEMLYLYSGLRSWVGLGEATQRQDQRSCHTRVSSDRRPAALAIDISLSEATSLKEHAAFFHRLGALARHHKLRWGGDWTRRNATWRTFNLGWDPGHVESLRCR